MKFVSSTGAMINTPIDVFWINIVDYIRLKKSQPLDILHSNSVSKSTKPKSAILINN